MEKFTIVCPHCESVLTVDAKSGVILTYEEKFKKVSSFEELKAQLEKDRQKREQIFMQEMASLKERERILEEKFKEALKRTERDSDNSVKNPLDLD